MKPLKKPIKLLNYGPSSKVYLYESECFLSCFNMAGASWGYWSGAWDPPSNNCSSTGFTVPDATNTNICGSSTTTTINCSNCGSSTTTTIDVPPLVNPECGYSLGVPSGCKSVLCADGAMVSPEGYQCTRLQSWTGKI